ncbi:Sucrose transport protein [Hondaea fermentalgiana]|uniref:Sucrose transport protein n=1 Tax=Hondaea fermentalgiana TaxID=2315210 RepID=A0A2R5GY36_9STRA|nr:Sucrose transport protein [Hondaea fermentalgiana]|eukprot:GBG33633.1 Sucrose transport protein [Hondaea fermentalgiana]
MKQRRLLRKEASAAASDSPVGKWAGLTGMAVEFTWAVQESTIVPYLLWLHVPLRFTGFTYLVNPIVGVGLQLGVGRLSDAIGRRKPFLAGLTVTGGVGLFLLMLSYRLGSSETSVAIVAMIGFAISDVSHDSLLIPARAMIEDLTMRDPDCRNELNARFSRFQMVGRLLAMLLGAFPVGYLLDVTWFSHVPASSPSANHLVGLVLCAFLVLVATSCTVLWISPVENPAKRHAELNALREATDAVVDVETPPADLEGTYPLLNAPKVTPKSLPWRRATLLTVHFYGWLVTMTKDFYWTAFLQGSQVGVMRVSFLGLGAGALCSFAVSLFLRPLNKTYGSRAVYFIGEILLMLSLLLLDVTGDGVGTIFVAACAGLSYAVHTNNMFLIVHNLTRRARAYELAQERASLDEDDEDEDDEDRADENGHGRKGLISSYGTIGNDDVSDSGSEDSDAEGAHNAWTISLVIAAMPAAQVIVGLFSGMVLEHVFKEDFVAFFTFLAKIGLVVNGAAIYILHR